MILFDTNILLRYPRAADPSFDTVDAEINALHAGKEELCVVPQNLYVFWAATRPVAAIGLGVALVGRFPDGYRARPRDGRVRGHSFRCNRLKGFGFACRELGCCVPTLVERGGGMDPQP